MIRVTNKNEKYVPLWRKNTHITICFNYEPFFDIDENGNKVATDLGTWSVHTFVKKPSFNQLKEFILMELNKQTDENILSGFVWKDMQVWLSSENQFNYKAAYDLAVQTNGANLPIVFKFGSTEEPIYYKFDTIDELTDFYTKAVKFINEQLAIG